MKEILIRSLIIILILVSTGLIISVFFIWNNYYKIVQKKYPLEIIEKNRSDKLQDGTCTK